MALDPRIKVNPDGSYFYSGSILTGKGRLYKTNGDWWEDDYIARKRQSKPFVFRLGSIKGIGDCIKYSRVDTTVPRVTFTRTDNGFTRSSVGSISDRKSLCKLIFSEWALTSPKQELIDYSSRRGLIVDPKIYQVSPPSYGHFRIARDKSDTRCIRLEYFYSKLRQGDIRIQLLTNSEADNMMDNLREEWESQSQEKFPAYDQIRQEIHDQGLDSFHRIVKLLQKAYIDGDEDWQFLDGYHCKILD